MFTDRSSFKATAREFRTTLYSIEISVFLESFSGKKRRNPFCTCFAGKAKKKKKMINRENKTDESEADGKEKGDG